MSYRKLIYHLVFGTKFRKASIELPVEVDLYKIIYHLCKEKGAFVHRIGGMPDHVHILTEIPATIEVSKFIQYVKHSSSEMARKSGKFPKWQGWGEGYGAFTLSAKDIEAVKHYIMNQKAHHINMPFQHEFRQWLLDNGINEEEIYEI